MRLASNHMFAAMDKSRSIFYILAFAVLIYRVAQGSPSLATDESALVALKAHITSDPHRLLTSNWSDSSSVCSWIGVSCGLRHRRVTALNISGMNLSGSIPPQLGDLSFLALLDLSHNFFSGTLPQELSLMHRLRILDLSANNFTGDIPPWLGVLPKLEYLLLQNNSFTGVIPNSLSNASNLLLLDFAYNSLHGSIPEELGSLGNLLALGVEYNSLSGVIPPAIYNMSSLRIIAFTSNKLNGSLPIGMCTNLPFLRGVYLSNNHLTGQLPLNLSQCSQLQFLSLSYNFFSGGIPTSIWRLNSLRALALGGNYFDAILPREIGQLPQLERLGLEDNKSPFAGSVPYELFNISTLVQVTLFSSNLSGTLPTNLCYRSPFLQRLNLARNSFSGAIPNSISNCSNLIRLDLSINKFTGFVPLSLGHLSFLQTVLLSKNNLRSDASSSELSFITSLTNCRHLIYLAISNNPLQGTIPASIGNLSSSLQLFHARFCKIKGSIPPSIGNLSYLSSLILENNDLSGSIPFTLGRMRGLEGFVVQNNNLEGSIPEGVCDLHSLVNLYLAGNRLSGSIPACLGNISSLRYIFLGSNKLSSSIPSSLWHLKDLLQLDLSSNSLSGSLPPEMSSLSSTIYINLSMNQLSESIPSTIGDLQNLAELSLAHNSFEGNIPVSMGAMISLESLDISFNNLSGPIPKSLESLKYLNYFNVSFNSLSGEIPNGGPFRNFTMDSIKGNEALCGSPRFHVSLCPTTVAKKKSKRKKVASVLFVLAGVVAFIMLASLAFIFTRYRRNSKTAATIELISTVPQRISYHEILQATQQFNESNLLGIGSFGNVYRGVLRDGKAIAVKVFNLESEPSFNSFDVECEVLRNIRHRNLTRVISSCSNEDFRALVLEYMPKGNLDKWLYSHNYCLDVMQRLNIMIDVASALEYLHHGYSTPIVHCDLKPSNVLLDEEMTAHVSDFGIAKLLGDDQTTVLTNTLATLGYIAPEYGLEGLVSTRCDVYSYGVMLMETFTRKKPSDDMFSGDLSVKSWIESLLPDAPTQVIDANLLMNLNEENFDKNLQCASSLLQLALKCSAESARDRINMKEALAELQKIKRRFSQ